MMRKEEFSERPSPREIDVHEHSRMQFPSRAITCDEMPGICPVDPLLG